MTAAVIACRCGGYWLIGRFTIGARLRKMLDALPGAVIASTIAPLLFTGGVERIDRPAGRSPDHDRGTQRFRRVDRRRRRGGGRARRGAVSVPLQNRVDPFGELFAARARGTLMGNRGGRLHDAQQNARRAALGLEAVDLLPPRLQQSQAQGLGRQLHRIVLPRRSDGAGRRSPAVFRMPARGCARLCRAFSRRAARSGHGRHSACRTPCRQRQSARTASPSIRCPTAP